MAIVGHCGQENRSTTNYYQCLPSQVLAISCSPPGVLRTEHYLGKVTSISPTIFSQYYLYIRNVIKARFCQSFYHNKRFWFSFSIPFFVLDLHPRQSTSKSKEKKCHHSYQEEFDKLECFVEVYRQYLAANSTLLANTTVCQ